MEELSVSVYRPFSTTWLDYPSVEDLAILVFFQGCSHNCKGCHNKENQKINSKDRISYSAFVELIRYYSEKNRTNKLVFSGGDCLHPANREFVKQFLKEYGKEYDVCIYTGYAKYYIEKQGLVNFKFIKSGLYNEKEKQESLKTGEFMQLASMNQIVYNSNMEKVSERGRMLF